MLAGHFPFAYGARARLARAVVLMAIGAWARLFFNLRHTGRTHWWMPVAGAVAFVALAVWVERADDRRRRRRLRGVARGRQVFASAGCAACHTLRTPERPAPSALTSTARSPRRRSSADRVTNGLGVMPSFAGQADDGADRRGGRVRLERGRGSRIAACSRSRREASSSPRASRRTDAPATVAAFRRLLPLESRIIHVRWSGEAGWIPFGDLDLGLGPENATCYPHPGEIVLYPGGVSETEILLAYGYVNFASKAGQLAGNHFATIVEGNEHLRDLGKKFLWEGAQEIVFRET